MAISAFPLPQDVAFDAELVRRYGGAGPRYSSYPSIDRLNESFDADSYAQALASRRLGWVRPLSLYVHLPFCSSDCYFCACNKVVTTDHSRADLYLDHLALEISQQAHLLDQHSTIDQLHLGGGTPNFFAPHQLKRLMQMLERHFNRQPDSECSIEIDPRGLAPDTLAQLAVLGFNRISLGVQDLDQSVQQAINRVQSAEQTEAAIMAGRRFGFLSINIDLIYGLPRQCAKGFATTLATVRRWRPDRIALYDYAHLPERFKPQRLINPTELPPPALRFELLQEAVSTLLEAGYLYLGMDHFALPDDELAVALRQGRLQRNFQGYSTHADSDLIGLGVSAISKIGPHYSQNQRELNEYYDTLRRGHLPIARGLTLNADDLVRRAVIQALLCQSELAFEPIETAYLIDFRHYFAREWPRLEQLATDGLIELETDGIVITPRGRLLARAVALTFDRYLSEARDMARFSRII
ncbi:oxygen-independent coproporphyrinogen III oxidase [Chitinimonas lacunae]|uniref:Coproporphyrinogen-III oxidase n=1 Tax=Chitinimonas lacunae TaxID=1963018 RepID=A0ABV8MTA5_9NEIS